MHVKHYPNQLLRTILLAGLLLSGSLLAEEPEWKSRLTRLPPGDFAMLESCELVYHLSWSNILKAGETRIHFSSKGQNGRTPGEVYARSEIRSAGLARPLWPYDAKTETWVNRQRLQPIRVLQEEEDRQERNVYRTNFNSANVVNEWTTVEKKAGSTPVVRNRTYAQMEPPMHDLMSAMLYLRSLPLRELDQPLSLVCYPFRDPYLVTVTPLGKDTRNMLGQQVAARKFSVNLAKIESDLTLKAYDPSMKSAYFWISDDDRRLPLELRADIFIGSILVTLKEYRDLNRPATASNPMASLLRSGAETKPARPRVLRKSRHF